MRIDIYHHFVNQSNDEIRNLLQSIKGEIKDVIFNLQTLRDAVAKETTVTQSVLTLLTNLASSIADLKQKLADAIAANDPVAIAEAQAELDAIGNTISSQADTLAAAVTANTPTPA